MSRTCEHLHSCCIVKQKQRDRQTCFIAIGKARAENPGEIEWELGCVCDKLEGN